MSAPTGLRLAPKARSEAEAGGARYGPARRVTHDRAPVAAVGLLAFAVYLLTLSRGVLGGDAGELQFVPPILGLTHPTGYPLEVLLHFAWSFVPIGSIAYRLNLLDALLATGAVVTVVALTRAAGAGAAASAVAGLSLAFGELWWSQAVRGDKYTLNGLFLALVLLLFVRWRAAPGPGRLAMLALVFGLSLAHHRSMLLVAPALGTGLALSGWRPGSWRAALTPIALAALPLLLYAYVPWAGARGLPPGSWPVDSPAAFAEFLLDRGYTSQIRPDAAFGGRLVEEAWVAVRSFGPLGVALGLVGLGASFLRDRRLALVLLLAWIPQAILGASYLLESTYQLPRHWVFFLPGFVIFSVWLGLGLEASLGWIRRRTPTPRAWTVAAVVIGLLAVQAGSAWSRGAIVLVRSEAGAETLDAWRQDLQRSPLAERFGRLAFASAAPNATIVSDWEQATVLWYLQRVEAARPDLTIVYPIERLGAALAEARASGRVVYLSRTLPGVEARGVISSAGPLLQVAPVPSAASPPPSATPLDAPFASGLTLAAADLRATDLRPGSVIPFMLYWRADARLDESYAVLVRLVGADGSVLASHDERHPALGTSPTSGWPVGQVVGDYHELPIGSRVRPGRYGIQVVPYRVDPPRPLQRIEGGRPMDSSPDHEGLTIPIEVGPRALTRPLDLLAFLLAR
jgi:hypothetical protein